MSLYATINELLKESGINILHEDTIYNESKLSIQINPTEGTNFKYDPYIKVYDGSYKSAKNVARVYLKDAGIDYSHRSRFGDLSINSKLGKQINEIMASVARIDKEYDNNGNIINEKKVTYYDVVWEILRKHFSDIQYIPCPDFTKCYIRKV